MTNYRMIVRGFFTRERKGGWGSAFQWLRLSFVVSKMETKTEYALAS